RGGVFIFRGVIDAQYAVIRFGWFFLGGRTGSGFGTCRSTLFQLGSNQLLVGTGRHQSGTGAHGLGAGFVVAETTCLGNNTGQQCRSDLFVQQFSIEGLGQIGNQLAEAAGVRVIPVDTAEATIGRRVDAGNSSIMQDTAVRGDSLIEILLLFDAERYHDIDVEVAFAELQIVFTERGPIRGDEDTDHVFLDLVTELVSF